ncbi:MAG: hypothetical protein JWP65_3897 [Ramlibacter sp.]|jgi:hypothetical protein|uniref:hypothetical protein n=1 Tax=Ramlibacter sp. TaxID=1917967 RepID=UPI0026390718|nr:hypothetical protein [Ramlibacter sp.]MDB5753476.1 hypothetical protein [Ramlibacter sp.]
MIRMMLTAVALAATTSMALAKLPAPVLDDAAKAKAAQAAASAAWSGKVEAYKLCLAQDRIAANYKKAVGSRAPAMAATAAAVPGSAAAAAAAAAPATVAAKPAAPSTAAMASQGGGTPVAVSTGTLPASGCADPGPFAYAPPAEKPLETSGAHSPAANASSPPSVRAESATMAPAKPATAQSKRP